MVKMTEEILTLEELFREEKESINEMLQQKRANLYDLDWSSKEYYELKNTIVMLEQTNKYLELRLLNKL